MTMTKTLAPGSILTASPDAIASEVDGEVMLICVTSGRYFGLDSVGSEIWRRVQAPLSLGALTAQLKAHFSGDDAVIAQETEAFVATLVDRGLVRTAQQ